MVLKSWSGRALLAFVASCSVAILSANARGEEITLQGTTLAFAQSGVNAGQNRAQPSRRLVLVIDYSGSMNEPYDGGDQAAGANGKSKVTRWEYLKARLGSYLRALAAKSRDFSVDARFFSDQTRPGGNRDKVPEPLTIADLSDTSIAGFLQQFPPPPPWYNNTALFQAVSEACDDTLAEDRTRRADARTASDCLFLLVVSDGEDTASGRDFQDGGNKAWARALRRLNDGVQGCRTGVLPVGKEAEAAQRGGKYGSLTLSTAPPEPPAPTKVYGLLPVTPATVAVDRPVRKGDRFSVAVTVQAPPDLPAAQIEVSTVAETFAVRSNPRLSAGTTIVSVEAMSDAPQGMDFALSFSASQGNGTASTGAQVSGTATRTYRFRPAEQPDDPSKWALQVPKFVRFGDVATCSVTIANASDIRWSFSRPGSKDQTATGSLTEMRLPEVGDWAVSIAAKARDGEERLPDNRKPVVRVLDGRCEVRGDTKLLLLKPATFRAEKIGPSRASYRWFVNGQVQDGATGETLQWTPRSVGPARIACEATTEGDFKFVSRPLEVECSIRPGAAVTSPDMLVEGASSFRFDFSMYDIAQLGWSIGGVVQKPLSATYPPDGLKVCSVSQVLNAEEIRSALALRSDGKPELEIAAWGLDAEGKSTGDRFARTIPVLRMGISVALTTPRAGEEVFIGQSQPMMVRIQVTPPTVVQGGDQRDLDRLRDEFLETCRVALSVVGPDGKTACGSEQPELPAKSGEASISIVPTAADPSEVFVRATVRSPRLLREPKQESLGSLKVSLPKADYALSTLPDPPGFSRFPIELSGLSPGETVEWTAKHERANDGISWVDGQGRTTIPRGMPPGRVTISATVKRVDGRTRVSVPAKDVTVKSTLRIDVPDAWTWDGGMAPPLLPVSIAGAAEELAQVERIEWTGIEGTGAGGSPTTASVAAVRRSDCDFGLQAQFGAEIRYKDGIASPTQLTATKTLSIAPPRVGGELQLTVAGATTSGRGGGPLAISPPNLSGTYCQGSEQVLVEYAPDALAESRGAKPKANVVSSTSALNVGPTDTGVWTATLSVQRPGAAARETVATATFTNLRTLDWMALALWICGAAVVVLPVFWIGGFGNEALWQGVIVGFDRKDISTRRAVRPKVRWLRSGKAPIFNLLTKRASCRLDEFGLLPSNACDEDRSRWLFDTDGSLSTEVIWQRGKRPRLEDIRRHPWHGEPKDGILRYAAKPYQGSTHRSDPTEDSADADQHETPLREPILLRITDVSAASRTVPYIVAALCLLLFAGVCWHAVWNVL